MIRSFISVELDDDDTREKIRLFQERLKSNQKRITLVNPDILHITVKFLGDIKESIAPKIYEIIHEEINQIMFQGKSLNLVLEGVGQFRNHGVIWVQLKGDPDDLVFIQDVKDKIETLLNTNLGIKKDRRSDFKAHMTIARLRNNRIDYKTFKSFKNLIKANKDLTFGRFTIDKIKLKKSVLTPQGPIYSDLEY